MEHGTVDLLGKLTFYHSGIIIINNTNLQLSCYSEIDTEYREYVVNRLHMLCILCILCIECIIACLLPIIGILHLLPESIQEKLARYLAKKSSDGELVLIGCISSGCDPSRSISTRLVFEELARRTYNTLQVMYTGRDKDKYKDCHVQALVDLSIKMGDHKVDGIIRDLVNKEELYSSDNPLVEIYLINNKLVSQEDRIWRIANILSVIMREPDKYKYECNGISEILKKEYETLLNVLRYAIREIAYGKLYGQYSILTHLLTNFDIKEEDMIELIERMYDENMEEFADNLILSQV